MCVVDNYDAHIGEVGRFEARTYVVDNVNCQLHEWMP